MFAVGHISLGYLVGNFFARILKVQVNVPLVIVLSIIPDIDIIFELLVGNPAHRGPTHSLIFAFLIFIPFFIIFKKRALPYFFSLASHSVLADFFIGGDIQLFWPPTELEFAASQYGFPAVKINDPANIGLELGLFIFAVVIMAINSDFLDFFKSNLSNLLLVIPVITVLLPTFTSYPLPVPTSLVYPHLFYLILFIIAGLWAIKKILL